MFTDTTWPGLTDPNDRDTYDRAFELQSEEVWEDGSCLVEALSKLSLDEKDQLAELLSRDDHPMAKALQGAVDRYVADRMRGV